ncbi:hypothetical protein GBA52_016198 [Prunus armeniaca]|nr:hypothetical protein GBA52_016198 [Prunus armeniaca]
MRTGFFGLRGGKVARWILWVGIGELQLPRRRRGMSLGLGLDLTTATAGEWDRSAPWGQGWGNGWVWVLEARAGDGFWLGLRVNLV